MKRKERKEKEAEYIQKLILYGIEAFDDQELSKEEQEIFLKAQAKVDSMAPDESGGGRRGKPRESRIEDHEWY